MQKHGVSVFPISIDSEICITKADYAINLVRPEGNNFFKVLHNKLGWGV